MDLPKSYSGFLEDICILRIIKKKRLSEPITYLEIGVNDPKIISNTYLFYENGYRGVLVEPLPQCCDKLREVRPEDFLIEGAIGWDGRDSGVVKMKGRHGGGSYITDDKWKGSPGCYEILMHWINDVLSAQFPEQPPTFMSIDTEGNDLNILKTLDFKRFPIPIICAEIDKKPCRGIFDFMAEQGYHWEVRNPYNAIFVKN